MMQNKNHWYDGWFYDRVIAPNQDQLFGKIKNLIEVQSKVIDVGCGTGRLGFLLADKCNAVLGVDLSKRNIDRAQLTLNQRSNENVSFLHRNLSGIIKDGPIHFDYAVLSYVIHEVDESERVTLLNEIAQIADKIIIGDYLTPKPKGFWGYLSEVIEFIAGADHYRNYKSYMANGGIYSLANKAGLTVISEQYSHPDSYHLVTLIKQ